MASFLVTFVGDQRRPETNPPSITLRGVEFPLNAPVHLKVATAEGESLLKKLQNNHHFKVTPADPVPVEAAPLNEPEQQPVAKRRGRPPLVRTEADAEDAS